MAKAKKHEPAEPRHFYPINEDFVAFKHDDFEEVEIRVFNHGTPRAARATMEKFILWLQGKGPGRQ